MRSLSRSMPTVRLVSFLGLGNPRFPKRYEEVVYAVEEGGDTRKSRRTPLVQAALDELFSVTSVRLLGTKEVHENWIEGDGRLLEEVFPTAVDFFKVVNTGSNAEELRKIFQEVVDALSADAIEELGEKDPPETILLDVTHGFRIQPMLGLAAASFVQSQWARKGVEKRPRLRVVYGAYEAADRDQDPKVAPIWDLTEFLNYARWSDAFNALIRFGRADELHQIVDGLSKSERAQLENKSDRTAQQHINWLRDLGIRAKSFTDDLATTRSEHIQDSASSLSRILNSDSAEDWISTYPVLREAVGELRAQSKTLDVPVYSNQGMRAVVAMAEQLIRSQQYSQALILISEALDVACGLTRCSANSDKNLVLRKGKAALMERLRQQLEATPSTPAKNSVGDEDTTLNHWMDAAAQLRGDVEASRNTLAHAGFSLDGSGAKASKIIKGVKTAHKRFSALIDKIPAEGAYSSKDDTTAHSSSVFLNLSFQRIADWPVAQRNAAKDIGEPEELEGWNPAVPSDTPVNRISAIAQDYAQIVKDLGVKTACVEGDPSLTLALVALLQREGVACYHSVNSEGQDQSFKCWREYPSLLTLMTP